MTGIAFAELTAEVDAAVRDGTPARRARMLGQFAAFFLAHADRLDSEQLYLFDSVLERLASRAELRSLAETEYRPCRCLACAAANHPPAGLHENPAVAAPVLASDSLGDADLIEIASHRSQQHLIAISKREQLGETLTETILKHSGKDATRALARNASACFNGPGYAALLASAERDDTVAESLGMRPDVPTETLQSLLAKTTDVVRARLLKGSSPGVRERVKAMLDTMRSLTQRRRRAMTTLPRRALQSSHSTRWDN